MRCQNTSVACINRSVPKGGLWSPLVLLLVSLFTASTSAIEPYQAGTHYRQIGDGQVSTEQAIAVDYWFWLGCASCQVFEQRLAELEAADLQWRQIPAQLRPHWYFHAKAFLVAQQQPQAERLLAGLSQQLVNEPESLTDIDSVVTWFVEQGVDVTSAEQQLLSPLLNEQIDSNLLLQQQLAIRGVPTLVIGNQYLVDAGMVQSVEEFIGVAKYLLDVLRQHREEAGFEWSDDELLEQPLPVTVQ
ncbi:thiol:disulfide interchange protein DsbA [Neiella marina]|uniref:Thiol:disulfide interchange protein DsbA n=1 Tax=Neiella marina TaxID=508461 RepID=A0A8J2U1K5_9GAMM|nr:DsbA family protein [Neiella marina]GGA63371.1 thiol:disulfide interchange protein DsbA [Neiella marina]